MEKLVNWIILIIGILLILPLIGVASLAGIDAWLIAIGVLLIGLVRLFKK